MIKNLTMKHSVATSAELLRIMGRKCIDVTVVHERLMLGYRVYLLYIFFVLLDIPWYFLFYSRFWIFLWQTQNLRRVFTTPERGGMIRAVTSNRTKSSNEQHGNFSLSCPERTNQTYWTPERRLHRRATVSNKTKSVNNRASWEIFCDIF